jgi:ABC-type nitrate/sulfonate/bicarbonate transport system substrate-binding protein
MPDLSASTHAAARTGSGALVVGSFTPSVLLDLAESTGALADAGLDVSEVPVNSSPAQFRSLLAGEVDVALTSPDNVLAYRYNPGNPLGELIDTRIVATLDRGMGLGLYGRPGLTAEGLRGARVAVDVPFSGFALALYALADSLGVRRDDYELLAQGSTPQRLRALLAGDSDATMLNAGNELMAEAAACPRLAGVEDLATPYLGTVVAVVGRDRLDAAARLAACLLQTAAAVVAGELDDAAGASAARRLRLHPQLAERYVERMRDPVHGLVPGGRVDEASLRTLVDLRRRYLPAPAPERDDGEAGDLLDAALEDPDLVHAASQPT